MCVHRGAEAAEGASNAKSFQCHYRGWVADLDGRRSAVAADFFVSEMTT